MTIKQFDELVYTSRGKLIIMQPLTITDIMRYPVMFLTQQNKIVKVATINKYPDDSRYIIKFYSEWVHLIGNRQYPRTMKTMNTLEDAIDLLKTEYISARF